MKKLWIFALFLLIILGNALAEESAQRALQSTDLGPLEKFAGEYAQDLDPTEIAQTALKGEIPSAEEILSWIKERLAAPVMEILALARAWVGPVLLLALLRCVLPKFGGAGGACFLLRLTLLLGFSSAAELALLAGKECIELSAGFCDVVAPAFAALLTAMGTSTSAALVSPAAALASSVAENLFLRFGLPVCRFALCTAIAGNLSEAIDLSRMTKLLKKTANWGTGLATTFFTAFLAVQGSVAGTADGVTVRTAKYAVDSAAPVIGSGISDAWDSYVSGILIAKNAVGVSGIATILLAGLRPVLICAASMIALNLISTFMGMLGEKEVASAAEQIGGICQMCLALSTGALAIAMVLLGGAMAAGGAVLG